jgi:hypothetical protein
MQRVKPKSPNGLVNFHPDQDAILAKSGKMETTHLTIEIAKAEDTLQIKLGAGKSPLPLSIPDYYR